MGRGRYHTNCQGHTRLFGKALSFFAGLVGTRAHGLDLPSLDHGADIIFRNCSKATHVCGTEPSLFFRRK